MNCVKDLIAIWQSQWDPRWLDPRQVDLDRVAEYWDQALTRRGLNDQNAEVVLQAFVAGWGGQAADVRRLLSVRPAQDGTCAERAGDRARPAEARRAPAERGAYAAGGAGDDRPDEGAVRGAPMTIFRAALMLMGCVMVFVALAYLALEWKQ